MRAAAFTREGRNLPADHAFCRPQIELLRSSRPLPWNGIVVEQFRARDVDTVTQPCEHVVSLLLRGPMNLFQRRNGRALQRTMHSGEIIITPAGAPKVLRHVEEVEILKLRVAPSLLESIVAEIRPRPAGRVEILDEFGARDPCLEGIARRLFAKLEAEGYASRMYVETLTKELAIHLLRHYSSARKAPEEASSGLPRHKLQRAKDFIEDNLREELTLEQISQALSMSPFHFAHLFRQSSGLAPHRYIIQRRMERAKSLLRETELPITQIAHEVGYSNQSHFSIAFHKFAGQTPREYRSEL